MIHILIVDDHPAIGEGTRLILDQEEDFRADYIDPVNQDLDAKNFDNYQVFILDLYMPEVTGLTLAKKILSSHPEAIIIIFTGFEISTHFNILLESGVHGFISKTASKEQFITSIRCALRGEVVLPLELLRQLKKVETKPLGGDLSDVSLTEREQKILIEVSEGYTNREIGENLLLSQRSIEYSLTGIFSKLGVKSRTEALRKADKLGLIPKVGI
ncbi:response regulator transcription factor [Mesobacillus subterraneus]|uniref:response regulator transcription factor n=1 Tax=Mesobacillus subterraneus TaxID=285983 RepID=UPI00273FFB6A|nr:response regulator transcription factor [Mesobacillus subterraneus]WLR54575.1 response regulator transcription factor [Mesobacillus subterraneus]